MTSPGIVRLTLLEIVHRLFVLVAQKRDGDTCLSGTTGTTDTMDILFDCRCHLPVDDAGDIGHIDTTSSLKREKADTHTHVQLQS